MFKKYIPFFKGGAMSMMAYKFNLFSWFFISLLQWLCLIFLWLSVFKGSEGGINSIINGFTFNEMIVYVILMNILGFTVFNSETMDVIADEIKDGTIAISFIRPISYRARFIAQTLGLVSASGLILVLPALIISMVAFNLLGFVQLGTPLVFAAKAFIFLFVTLFAVLINDAIGFLMGTLCFYTTQAFGINMMKNGLVSFLSGSLLPLSFFPGVLGKIVQYLPFAGIAQNPVLIIQGKTTVLEAVLMLGKNIVWFIFFEGLCALCFHLASKKVTVQGG